VANLTLIDLVAPYLVRGENIGPNHAIFALIRVVSYQTSSDSFGVTLRGRCEFNGQGSINLGNGQITLAGVVNEGAPAYDPTQRDPVFDLRETALDFELFVPRIGSAIIAAGTTSIGAASFNNARNVLNALDTLPLNLPPSDYPASDFTLDLMLVAPTFRPPFLHPAKMTEEGLLVPDASFTAVSINLSKLRFRLTHDNVVPGQLTFDLVSAGASGLDDPGDIGVAELISMTPPYAFVGGATDRTFGFGFRGAVLDLSNDSTPPAVVEKFGFGDDWGGLYFPEVRIFIAPEGVRDLAFEAGVNDLLIGFGASSGISGDFEVAVINQGGGDLVVGARFFDETGRAYGIDRINATTARVRIPEHTRLVIDVVGGRAPYQRQVAINGGAAQSGVAFNLDLSSLSPQVIVINVSDSTAGTPKTATLTITAEKRTAQATLPGPTPSTSPAPALEFSAPDPTPQIVKIADSGSEVLLTTDPVDPNIRWSHNGGAETAAQSSLTVEVFADNQLHTVSARRPSQSVPGSVDFFFYYDEPDHSLGTDASLAQYGQVNDNVAASKARSELRADGREGGDSRNPLDVYADYFDLIPNGAALTIDGEASFENDLSKRQHNYFLARRRAITVREMLSSRWASKNFVYTVTPGPTLPPPGDPWSVKWQTHTDPRPRWWKANVPLPPGLNQAEQQSSATLRRPTTPSPPAEIPVSDPPAPSTPRAPDWFRSIKLKVRIVRDTLIAAEVSGEVDFQTATESQLNASGELAGNAAPDVHSLSNGAPLAPNNPADGITDFRLLYQKDHATGQTTTMLQIGADPADKDGLLYAGWIPGQAMPANKDYGVTLLGSYLSFWPLLVEATSVNVGDVEDALLTAGALAIPGVIALLPWFRVERVILFGGEAVWRERNGENEVFLLFDVGIDWSVDININGTKLIEIERNHPLAIRYKAIGLRFGNRADDGTDKFTLRPVFDSSRGYTIDVARGGSLKVAPPFDQILRVLGARISRTNPLTFEIDIGMGVDLGVVSIERARVRVYLDAPKAPELTALAASINIPGAVRGSGYLNIGTKANNTATIGGQIDLTLVSLNLRISAALEIAQIPPEDGGPATGIYVGIAVVLPAGIPLGSTGLGIFGFRGIFGMHYERNSTIGAGASVPTLEWLQAADGQPHLLSNNGIDLWVPHIDRWSFGLGILIGTMEGGVILNLDGTLLLELPGPRLLIMMNARLLTPPPSVDALGTSGGILAVIEITPEHFLIGILVEWDIEHFITIRIPVEAFFPYPPNSKKWHIYLGKRGDIADGKPIEVNVLGLVKGTGYLMFKGDGLPAYKTLPEIKGFAIGLGAGASFVWGNVDAGLYLRIGGGVDAVIGFDPFLLGGLLTVNGELRLFIISIGAYAELTVIVAEQASGGLKAYLHGKACGRVEFLFFSVEGCVDITIQSDPGKPAIPALVQSTFIKSRSPALLQGSGVDRPIDGSLGNALQADAQPSFNDPNLLIVPIDSIPVVAMNVAPGVESGLSLLGTAINAAPGVPVDGFVARGSEKYKYTIGSITLQRVSPGGDAVIGTTVPITWWTVNNATGDNPVAQLALFTWEPVAASKAIEKSLSLVDSVEEHWGQTCDDAAPAAPVLWTFRYEKPGFSVIGWDLEGTAWPDPEDSRRSGQPDTQLLVTERWRTGDPKVDTMRGIFPALVLPGVGICYRKAGGEVSKLSALATEAAPLIAVGGRGPVSLTMSKQDFFVSRSDPLSTFLGARDDRQPWRITERLFAKAEVSLQSARQYVDAVPLQVSELHQRLEYSESLSNVQLAKTFSPTAMLDTSTSSGRRAATTPNRLCPVKLLQAPMLDNGKPIVIGDPSKAEWVNEQLKKSNVTHGPLDNVVVLHTGGFAELHLLLFVRRDVLAAKRMCVQILKPGGGELDLIKLSTADIVPPAVLPSRWIDAGGPWADDIAELLSWQHLAGWLPVLVNVGKQLDADRVELGVIPGNSTSKLENQTGLQLNPDYYLAAVEATRGSEVKRQEWDESQIKHEREVITQMLGPASSQNALLYPNSLYKLQVSWSGERQKDGNSGIDTQTFWFKTDANAPKSLTPWLLCSLPSDDEDHVFYQDPLRIIFNTHDVDKLYEAYGKELRIRLQAASAQHPTSSPGAQMPYPITGTNLHPLKAAILSPWEEAVSEVLQGSCIPIDEERIRHSEVKIPILLKPFMGYILDIEMVDIGAPENASGERVFRQHFTTGAFTHLSDLAASLQAVKPGARFVTAGGMNNIRTYFAGRQPQGAELDHQLRDSGLDVTGTGSTRVVVYWEQVGNNPPQPAAVWLSAVEPLWRSRGYPTKVTDNSGPVPADRWVLAETEWLLLEETSSIIAPNGLLRAPGGQGALIILANNSRGKTLTIDLVARAIGQPINVSEDRHPVVDITFNRAPWEEA